MTMPKGHDFKFLPLVAFLEHTSSSLLDHSIYTGNIFSVDYIVMQYT